MEMNQHCLDTLRKLAQGIDPRSGLPLPEEDACQAPEVIRALFQAIQALEAQGKVRPSPEQAGKPWNEEEEQALLQRFDEGEPVTAIARAHGRTTGAIRARLVQCGRL